MLTAVDEVFRRSLTTLLTLYLVVGIGLMVALILIIRALVLTYLENRDTRVAACPKTERYAAEDKDIDALYAALFGAPALRITNCSRRPEGAERVRPGRRDRVA